MNQSSTNLLFIYNIILLLILSMFFHGLDEAFDQYQESSLDELGTVDLADSIDLQVSEPQYEVQVGYSEVERAHHFVLLNVRVTNKGREAHRTNPDYFRLVDQDGETYSIDRALFDIVLDGKEFPTIDLQRNTSTEGVLVFQIPDDVTAEALIYSPFAGGSLRIEFP